MTAICRFATPLDWPGLREFYRIVYRKGHPLHDPDFWRWQFGDRQHGQAAIVVDGERVVGHLGTTIAGGFGTG